MIGEFKAFIARGNVVDLAVAVIIGAAFGKVISSFTDDIIMPVIGAIMGDVDFSNRFVILGDVPADYQGALTDYVALKAAGVPMLGYGMMLTALVNFLIIAFALFLLVRAVNRLNREKAPEPAPAPAPDAEDIVLLREIRDALKSR